MRLSKEQIAALKDLFRAMTQPIMFSDVALFLFVLLLLGIFRPDAVLVFAYLLLIPYLLITKRYVALKHLSVASLLALLWMLFGHSQYSYNQEMLILFGINLYALFAWALGLFAVYLLYLPWSTLVKGRWWHRLMLFTGMYWGLLIAAETIAYHLFNIRNIAVASYGGLPVCDCLHAPPWMQLVYFLLGPLFFLLCLSFGLELREWIKMRLGRH